MPPDLKEIIDKLDERRVELEKGEPQYWHETDAKSGAGEYRDLPEKPTVEQLRSALAVGRYDLSFTIEKVLDALEIVEEILDDLDRLRNHRHDTTKAYSGRPEL
jgi:hypothetical protein